MTVIFEFRFKFFSLYEKLLSFMLFSSSGAMDLLQEVRAQHRVKGRLQGFAKDLYHTIFYCEYLIPPHLDYVIAARK